MSKIQLRLLLLIFILVWILPMSWLILVIYLYFTYVTYNQCTKSQTKQKRMAWNISPSSFLLYHSLLPILSSYFSHLINFWFKLPIFIFVQIRRYLFQKLGFYLIIRPTVFLFSSSLISAFISIVFFFVFSLHLHYYYSSF